MKNTIKFLHITKSDDALFSLDGFRAHECFISRANMEYIRRIVKSEDCAQDHVYVDYPDKLGNRSYRCVKI